jgi:hypothetical protein
VKIMHDVLDAVRQAVAWFGHQLLTGLITILHKGLVGWFALSLILLGLVMAAVVIPYCVRRDNRFQAEWRAYVTAYNEGRRLPATPPRSPQVASVLAHNQRADALLAAWDQRARQGRAVRR